MPPARQTLSNPTKIAVIVSSTARTKKTESELLQMIKDALVGDRQCGSVHIRLFRGGVNWTVSVAQDGARLNPCYRRIVEISRDLATRYELAD